MTTTAFDDQFGESTEKHVAIQPYDIAAILRQNVADLQRELQRQRERADKAEATLKESQERHAAATARLRDQIERVTSEWERAEAALASARDDLQPFIDSRDAWMARAEAAEAELAKLREQEPVAKVTSTVEFGGGRHFNVQWLKPEAMKSGQTLYTRPIPAPAVPDVTPSLASLAWERAFAEGDDTGIDFSLRVARHVRALLQSAGGGE